MNIIEKYDKPFRYGAIVLNVIFAYKLFVVWYTPNITDATKILSYVTLMAFEFAMVHSGLFMAFLPKRTSLFLLVPLYGAFALAFNSFIEGNDILILYCVVVFNRMRYAFFNVKQELKNELILKSVISVIGYFFLLLGTLLIQSVIPELGLTKDFLAKSNFYKDLTITGLFVSQPQIPLFFGVLYYLFLAITDAYLINDSNKVVASRQDL
ncbi:hypothetical protein IZU89_07960 [Cellulophaga lytica]|uniref:Uncharacterized protein n=1 Tax=Cellulophaga geojensis KL-A TaxID=1328323 RepID=A0ABN0RL99_9FLAO|nr:MULTISPECIES: hypothetical protein [Cellulophaga]EWH12549.1 hypothetical protein KLA_14228 [Cellulophaga geojensis KL-A]MDO6852162.1 hypothetical protein [Cellulophaga lytica]SNQ42537.1 conserved membrane hypothetical protein [Cellulophaga lytica]